MKNETLSGSQERQDLIKGYARLGETPGDFIKWAITFAFEKRSALSTAELEIRNYELLAFVRFGIRSGLQYPPGKSESPSFDTPGGWGNALSKITLPAEQDVFTLQERTRQFLSGIPDGPDFEVPISIQKYRVEHVLHPVYHVKNPEKNQLLKKVVFIPILKNSEDAFIYLLGHLLSASKVQIDVCPECQQMFLKHRRNQKFCGVNCQSRVATRKFLGIPDARKGMRGRPPREEEVKKSKKAKTKVEKRKRRK